MGCNLGVITTEGEGEFEVIKRDYTSQGEMFTDESFPLTDSIFIEEGSTVDVKWLRPTEICNLENKTPKFIMEDPSRFDIKQGALGDCWFLTSMANMAEHPSCFEHVVPTDNGDFESDDYCGIFHFRFWRCGKWVDIIIDDFLPTNEGKLVFVHSEHSNVFWSALLEKAFAKFHGSYAKINGGFEAESFEYLTGGIGECYEIENAPEYIFYQLLIYLERNYLICCSIKSLQDNTEKEDLQTKAGLVDGHAYSLTGAKNVSEGALLVRVRNPWGTNMEWKGAWSDSSKEWTTLSEEEREEMELTFEDDGEFWMRWEDFLKYFYKIDIGFLNPFSFYKPEDISSPPSTYTLTIESKWTEKTVATPGTLTTFVQEIQDILKEENEEIEKEKENEEIEKEKENDLQKSEEQAENDLQKSEEQTENDQQKSEEQAENENIQNLKDEEDLNAISVDKSETDALNENIIEEDDQLATEEPKLISECLSKSPQYALSVSKLQGTDEKKKYKLVICLMVKNRRENIINGNFNPDALNIHLFKLENSEVQDSLTTEFFDGNRPLKGVDGVNYAEEKIFGVDIPHGEYCLVLSSEKEAEFFVRIFCENSEIKIRALANDREEEDDIGDLWNLIFT